MDLPCLLATLNVDRALPWTTAAREFRLPSTPDAATVRVLTARGVVVRALTAKRTGNATRRETVMIVCLNAEVAAFAWHSLVQLLGLAAARRTLGVPALASQWASYAETNVQTDPANGNRFRPGVYQDGHWHEVEGERRVRTWLLEYSSGKADARVLAEKVCAYGKRPQCWVTASASHQAAIERAFTAELPGYPHVRVILVDWTGSGGRDARGSSDHTPTKETSMSQAPSRTTAPAASSLPADRAGVPESPLSLEAFFRGGELLEPGVVAEALGVTTARVSEMARVVEGIVPGARFPRAGKDRRFSRGVLNLLRRAQVRSQQGTRFEVALREELGALGFVRDERHGDVGRAVEERLLSVGQDAQRLVTETEARMRELTQAFEERSQGALRVIEQVMERQKHMSDQLHSLGMQANSARLKLEELNAVTLGTVEAVEKATCEARRYLPHELEWRRDWQVLLWSAVGAVFALLIQHLFVWARASLGW